MSIAWRNFLAELQADRQSEEENLQRLKELVVDYEKMVFHDNTFKPKTLLAMAQDDVWLKEEKIRRLTEHIAELQDRMSE